MVLKATCCIALHVVPITLVLPRTMEWIYLLSAVPLVLRLSNLWLTLPVLNTHSAGY